MAIARELLDARDQARQLEGAEIALRQATIEARELLQPLLDDSDPAIAQRMGFHLAQYGDAEALGLARDLVLNPEMPEDLRLRAMALVRTHGAQLVPSSRTWRCSTRPGARSSSAPTSTS